MSLRNPTTLASAMLLLLSVSLFLFPDSNEIFIITILLTSAWGFYGLFLLITRSCFVKFFNVMAVGLLLGYSVGTAIIVLVNMYYIDSLDRFYGVMSMRFGKEDMSMALLLVLLACIVLFELSRFETSIVDKIKIRFLEKEDNAGKYILLSSAIVIMAYSGGQIGFLGVRAGELGNIGVLGSLAFLIVPPLLPIVACEIIKDNSFKYKVFLILIFLLFLLTSILFGRRIFLYSLVSVFIGLCVSGFRLSEFIRRRWITAGICIVVLPLLVFVCFLLFFAMRMTEFAGGDEESLITILWGARDIIGNDPVGMLTKLSTNVVDRPFILSYLSGLVSVQNDYPPLWGKETYYALQTAIPSFLFPEKLILLPKMAEEFVHPAFGMPVFDGNNTIITAGLNDFGIAGAIFYPVMAVIVFIAYLEILYRYIPFVLFQIVLYRLIFQIMFVEETLGGIIPVCLRDLTLVVALLYIASKTIEIMLNIFNVRQMNGIERIASGE